MGKPEFVLLKASAGSGKTHALSLKFLDYVLSSGREGGPSGAPPLQRILAITFTKNAAREMKERILTWLKDAYLGDAQAIEQIREKAGVPASLLPSRAGRAVERILDEYTDFQVETIDSFMATVFKASAVDLGFAPDFEIVLESAELLDEAFYQHLRTIHKKSPDAPVFERILDDLNRYRKESEAFAWDPTGDIRTKLGSFHARLTAQASDVVTEDLSREFSRAVKSIGTAAAALDKEVQESGLPPSARSSLYSKIRPAVAGRTFSDLVGASFKTVPVKKPAAGSKDAAARVAYALVEKAWKRLEKAVAGYSLLYARTFFAPYLQAYRSMSATLDSVKRRLGVVFIEDLNRQLARYIDAGLVPDIYFRLGDRIDHFLIDEFQDTSPIQWRNLRPLIEESLSRGGSLFIVGDTKQAIYGFRDADYRIMRDLEEGTDAFPSVERTGIEELRENWRSGEAIQSFVRRVFLENPDPAYREVAARSGLCQFDQEVIPENRGRGYVEYVVLDKAAEGETENGEDEGQAPEGETLSPGEDGTEKGRVQSFVRELRDRGYANADIAILTYKNETVVRAASWLNEIDVPIIPFSSLDIRERKIVGEILALLRFLDSPPDDLSFGAFLLGEVFGRAAAAASSAEDWRAFLFERRGSKAAPLYAAFRERFPALWNALLEPLFKSVGFSPLYDIAVSIYRAFDVFARFPGEEASLAKLLEVIKAFEADGKNDIGEFLAMTGEAGGEAWTVDVPEAVDAVRIMTIHKAKGLGFPVVILLLYGEQWRAPDFFLSSLGEAGVRVLKINKPLAEIDDGLRAVYEETRSRDEVNRLNTLYVALTRAAAELYVIGVKGPRDKFPFTLLGEGFVSAGVKPEPWRKEGPARGERAALRWNEGPFEVPSSPREALNAESRRRGELVHRLLAGIEYAEGGWATAIGSAVRALRSGEEETRLSGEIGAQLASRLEGSPLAAWFERRPGRRILRELVFCDGQGRAYRLDRVVVDPDAVLVIDFKTGEETPARAWIEAGRDQVRTYLAIVRDVFPDKAVRGLLAFVDRGAWEAVE